MDSRILIKDEAPPRPLPAIQAPMYQLLVVRESSVAAYEHLISKIAIITKQAVFVFAGNNTIVTSWDSLNQCPLKFLSLPPGTRVEITV